MSCCEKESGRLSVFSILEYKDVEIFLPFFGLETFYEYKKPIQNDNGLYLNTSEENKETNNTIRHKECYF